MSEKPLDCVGVDASRVDLGKSDFVPCPERPILYGEGKPPVVDQSELAAVTRERDALKAALERCCKPFVLANTAQGIRVEAMLREFALRHQHALETLARLESGELRKP